MRRGLWGVCAAKLKRGSVRGANTNVPMAISFLIYQANT